jgi:hypothetical protein
MPDGDEVQWTGRARPARHWPMVVAVLVVIALLSGTAVSFFRDRMNAAAATSARSNAAQDALALAAATTLVHAFDLDASLRRAGVVGLRSIVISDFGSMVVAPLGGVIENGRHQWSLALDGGFACLTWKTGPDQGEVTAGRGLCSDNTPLITTPAVSARAFLRAERYVGAREQAAVEAAIAAGALASSSSGYSPRFSLPVLATRFLRLAHPPFDSWATADGLNVATPRSTACLRPSASDAQVRVTLGLCD